MPRDPLPVDFIPAGGPILPRTGSVVAQSARVPTRLFRPLLEYIRDSELLCSQQITPAVEVATAPFHFALSTTAETECVSHVLQAMTDLDPMATVLSADGVGAFDFVWRTSMLRGLQNVERGGSVLLFVRQF